MKVGGAIVALFALALLGGCGGDDSGRTASKTTATRPAANGITKAEFIRRGDELCEEFRKVREPVGDQINETNDPSEQARLLRRLNRAFGKALRGFDALPKPAGDEAVLARYLNVSRENVVLVRRAAEEMDRGNQSEAITLLQNATDASEKAGGIAQGYGFKDCGAESK